MVAADEQALAESDRLLRREGRSLVGLAVGDGIFAAPPISQRLASRNKVSAVVVAVRSCVVASLLQRRDQVVDGVLVLERMP
jgi:hypothetical protein